MVLFDESKTRYVELDSRFTYLQEGLKLMIFRKNEEGLFSTAAARHGRAASKDSRAAQQMRRAARRQAGAADEILRLRREMTPPPIEALTVDAAWQKAYQAYSDYARAEAATWEAKASNARTESRQLRKLLAQSEDLQNKALKEQKKFARRLKLSGAASDKLLADAIAAVTAQNWQPEEIREV